jgi:DNA-binding response OmpR family regulator
MVTGHKILIIDEDPDHVRATKSVLERYYQVSCAYTGWEGWQKLRLEKPDLIILDVMMEKKAEGSIFGKELRKERDFHDIPVIMLTGMKQQTGFFLAMDDPRHPKFLPVDVFMEKPVNPTELHECGTLLVEGPEKPIEVGAARDLQAHPVMGR